MKLGFSVVLGFLVAGMGLVSSPPLVKSVDSEQKPRTDPFGDPLPEGAIARLGTLRFRQGYHYAMSPDGKMFAASYGDVIRLVDSQTGKDVRQGRGHESFITCLAWSSDGKTIASGSRENDRSIRLWEPATMKETRR